jgi:chaperone BCS1
MTSSVVKIKNLYLQINLASGNLSDSSLHRTFLRLPKKCIVLIEDIDSAGVDREQGPLAQEPKADTSTNTELLIAMNVPLPTSRRPAKSHGKTTRSMVTLSGLLNAIDGTSSQEGRLLIMTSNSPDTLDPALTRPGRIDKKVYFGNMSKAAGKSIFMRLMGRSAIAHNTAFSMDNIEQYANEFADRIPANIFTPAQIQNFLQDYRGDARKALGEIDDWVLKNQDNP